MDWIDVNDEMFEYARQRTREADTALYGRVTDQMMEGYRPTAGSFAFTTRVSVEPRRRTATGGGIQGEPT
jgi:hypothetical protein